MRLHIDQLPELPTGHKPPKPVSDACATAGEIIAQYNEVADQRLAEIREIEAKEPEEIGVVEIDYVRTSRILTMKNRAAALESLREPVAVIAEWVATLSAPSLQETIDGLAEKLIALGWPIVRDDNGVWRSPASGPVYGRGAPGFLRSHPAVSKAEATSNQLNDSKSQWQSLPGVIESAIAESLEAIEEKRRAIVRSFATV